MILSYEQIARELYASFKEATDGPPWNGLTHRVQKAWIALAEQSMRLYEELKIWG